MNEPILSINREVASAHADGSPAVALESTIITHGMPCPDNVETALRVEVCAGMESILDLGLTLEYLETRSVPVIGYGTDVLPAFYCRESDDAVGYWLNTATEVANVMVIRRLFGLRGGQVVAPFDRRRGINCSAALARKLALC